ncbi:MAG: hypothetical protein LC745_09940 [Planctomycetia bacterium]|nr:hypothetical protein [Planctomycetia bacterium]
MPTTRVPHRIDLTFPARDERLDHLVNRLTERGEGPHADNLVSNEDSYPRVAGALARLGCPGGIYVGVGPDQNFTMIAQARPAIAFVVDLRRRNLLLHLLHKALFSLSPDRVAYLGRLTARRPTRLSGDPSGRDLVDAFARVPFENGRLGAAVAEVAAVLRPLEIVRDGEWAALATIQARLAGPGMSARFLALPMYPTLARQITTNDRDGRPAHFLASEPFYQVVRTCQSGDRVVPLVGDFAGPSLLKGLGDWLRPLGFSVDVFYASDVEFFLLRSGKFPGYVANLDRLPWSDGAVIVRTSTREIRHDERVPGDSSTTVLRPVAPFLKDARAGKIRTPDDLFAERP